MNSATAMPWVEQDTDDPLWHRKHCRLVFRAAYGRFEEWAASRASAPAVDYEQQVILIGNRIGLFPGNAVSTSDWLLDFDKAGRYVLRDLQRDLEVFVLHYLMGLAAAATMEKLRISGWRSWAEINKLIAERVGGELLRRRL